MKSYTNGLVPILLIPLVDGDIEGVGQMAYICLRYGVQFQNKPSRALVECSRASLYLGLSCHRSA
jgi:hypothetical protein